MGGKPPQGREHGGRDERAVQARGLSLAHLLGEEWRSDGDGIYRLVAPAESSEPVLRDERTVTSAPDDLDELIAELSADLVSEREETGAASTSANGDRSSDRH